MKKLIIAPVAAVVMLSISGYANASSDDSSGTGIDIYKKVHIENHTTYHGGAWIGGYVGVNKLGMAVIDSYQNSTGNNGHDGAMNNRNTNNAKIMGGSGSDLSGNIGINVSAGDNNVQANNTAITVLGESDMSDMPDDGEGPSGSERVRSGYHKWGGASVDAEISSAQVASGNHTNNQGNHNDAIVGGGSLNGAAGNLGVNVAAGNSNVQGNNFAVSYGNNAHMAVSTVDNKQFATGNSTLNNTLMQQNVKKTVGITLSGQVDGTYAGNSVQSNDVYPEIWKGPVGDATHNHPDAQTYMGHLDFDKTPSDSDVDSHFEFAEAGTVDLGTVSLSGKLVTYDTIVGRANINNAVLSGASLVGASGNVGVNITAGTNNLQSNSLALSAGNF